MMITENMPLVCILMPVYNSDLTLKTAIQSIINQTFTNWVCVIVNDGSTDKTKEILNNMNDTRFRIINLKQNMGRGYARQVCLDNSIGEYIAFLDADDFYHPNKIQLQVDLFQNNMNVSLVYCGLVSFDNKLIPQRMRGVKYADSVIKYMPNDCILFTPATVLIKREKAVTIKYCTSLNAAEDIDYFSRYLKNESYVGINYILYYYREDPKISKIKLISYYYYTLVAYMPLLRYPNIRNIYLNLIAFIKLLSVIIIASIFGIECIINNRGKKVTKKEEMIFSKIKTELNI